MRQVEYSIISDSCKFQVEKLQDGVGASEKSMCLLSERKSEAVNQINSVFGNLIEKIKERRQRLMEDVDSQFVSKMDQIRKFSSYHDETKVKVIP